MSARIKGQALNKTKMLLNIWKLKSSECFFIFPWSCIFKDVQDFTDNNNNNNNNDNIRLSGAFLSFSQLTKALYNQY